MPTAYRGREFRKRTLASKGSEIWLGRGGEIGILAILRISWSKDCAGSNPALGTKQNMNAPRQGQERNH